MIIVTKDTSTFTEVLLGGGRYLFSEFVYVFMDLGFSILILREVLIIVSF